MNTLHGMSALRVGQSAYVAEIQGQPHMRRRLQDIGLIPGTRVTCVAVSPAGDPAAYLIRGAVIALRRADAAQVGLEEPVRERAEQRRVLLA